MKQPDILRLLEFQKLLLQFSQIERVVHRQQGTEFISESDTEHSYNLAMTAWFLAQYFPQLNRDTVIRYALLHDMVEVHAGDTYVYAAQEQLDSKAEREAKALQKLKADWPDFAELTDGVTAYEQLDSEEAKFVYALDKIMPIMQIYISGGYTWKQERLTPERLDVIKRHKVALSEEIKVYYDQLYDLLLENQDLFKAG